MPTNAGTYKAKFSVADTTNYSSLTKEIEFSIAKKEVAVPTVASVTYDGKAHTATLSASAYYTVDLTNATGVVSAGEYDVTVTLISSNYKWSDGVETLERTLTFTIEKATDNAWTTAPSLSKTVWTYGDAAASVISAKAKYGETQITYVDASGNKYTAMPETAGTYKAQFILVETDNYNGLTTVEIEYTVNKRVVTVPTLSESSITYDGEKHTPIATNSYYTIGGDTDVSSIGSYSLIVSLISESCVWNDGTTAAKTYSFEIVKAQAVIENFELSKTEWTYGDSPATVSADSNVGNVVKYYYDTAENGAFTSTVMPTNAGVYYVKAVIADAENYDGAETEVLSFVIQKAVVTLTAPTYGETSYYENQVNVATAYETAPTAIDNLGKKVNGTFAYNLALGQAIANGKINVTITFTLSDTANYTLSENTVTVAINVKTVAYIASTNYGSVESALKNVTSGEIWVTAGLTDAVIAQNCTIPSGVTLNIPHTAGAMNTNGTATLSGSANGTLSTMSLKTNITLKAGVVLNNQGTLKIAGELSGGNGGSAYAGHTAGAYAKLTLDTNAQIVNTGTIHCFGIIAEKTVNNGSKVWVNSGSLYVPFVVRDFRGGSYMYAVYKKASSLSICPFNQFEFRNVTSLLQVNYGAKVYGYANLFASSQQNATTVSLVGTESSFLIQLTSGANVQMKYTPRVYSSATAYTETVGDTTAEGVMKLDFYGGATVNSMTLSIKVLGTVNISTSNYYFPLTWRFDINFHSGSYTMNNRYKMMAGAKLTVESDASLTLTEMSVYGDEDWTDTCAVSSCEPTIYTSRGDAILTVKGTLSATTLAGDVYIQGGTVTATNKSITTYEAINIKGSSFLASLKEYATIANTYNAINS